MSRFRLTREATEDILSIYLQGHDRFGAQQADRYHDELKILFGRLADFPRMGRLMAEFHPPVRVFAHKAHVILYDVVSNEVVIQRVRNAREDWWGDTSDAQEDLDP